jgi:hypothetical protein
MLAATVAMFAVFAGALAWAQLQTRNISNALTAGAAIPAKKRPF